MIHDLLPLCNAYPSPCFVVFVDNALFHHPNLDAIKQAYDRYGVWLRFLPLYSLNFNLIEESFRDLKAFIGRHYRRERQFYSSYQEVKNM